MRLRTAASLLIAPLALSGCDEDWNWEEFITGRSGQGELTLSLAVTESNPQQQVWLTVRGVELQRDDGETVRLERRQPSRILLGELASGSSEPLFEGQRLVAGEYTGLRLLIDTDGNRDSYVSDGGEFSINVQSGRTYFANPLRVRARESADYTINLDLRQSLVVGNTAAQLYPALRILRTEEAHSLSGRVEPSLLAGCTDEFDTNTAVYIYRGHDATLQDIRGNDRDPVATALVGAEDRDRYRATFLTPGAYTVSLTCQANNDHPRQINGPGHTSRPVTFLRRANVTIEDEDATQDFAD